MHSCAYKCGVPCLATWDLGPPLAVQSRSAQLCSTPVYHPVHALYMCTLASSRACVSQLSSTLVRTRVSVCLVMVFDSSGSSEGGPRGAGRAQAVWMDNLMSVPGPLRSLPPYQPPPHPQPAPPSRYHHTTYTSPWLVRVSSNRYLLHYW